MNDKEDVINYIKSTNCMSLNMELDLIEKEFNEKSFTSSDEYTDLVDEDHGKKLLDKVKELDEKRKHSK